MNSTPPLSVDRPLIPYFLILASIFAAAFIAGFVAPASLQQQALAGFDEFVAQFRDMSGGALFWFILVHNVIVTLVLVGAGLLFGIVPILAVGTNGFVLGIVYRKGAGAMGYVDAALAILPHGIFEIPAVLFAAAYGLWLGVIVIRRVRGKGGLILREYIAHAFQRYFAVAFPLFVIAASIETFLMLRTP